MEHTMPNAAIGFGIALIVLGLAGYFGTGAASPTALIPAVFGAALLAAGWLARRPPRRKLAMHIAAGVTLLGFLGAARGIPKFLAYLSGADVERPAAAVTQSIMALLCAIFTGLCVKSFVDARRARAAQ
jgi:uncharacterized membrane protein (UPF0136 family)